MILKTEETSKGSTCGYTLVLFEQARAHEYQFINILLKYCNISAQTTARFSPYLCFHHLTTQRHRDSPPQWVHPTKSHQRSPSGRLEDSLSPSPRFRAGPVSLGGWLVPFTSISWYPTLHHTPDLFPLHFQPPEGRGLVASCPKEETQDLLPNTCPTPLTLQGHKY